MITKYNDFLNENKLSFKQKDKENIEGYLRFNCDIIENSTIVGNILFDVNNKEIIIQSINSFKSNVGSNAVKLLKEKYPKKLIKGISTPNAIGFWKKMGATFDFNNPKPNDDDDTGDLIPFTLNESIETKSYYHITVDVNLPSIKESGIKKSDDGTNGVGVYLCDTIKEAVIWKDILEYENYEENQARGVKDWYIIEVHNLDIKKLVKCDVYEVDELYFTEWVYRDNIDLQKIKSIEKI